MIINVDMTYQCEENIDDYVNFSGKLARLVSHSHFSKVCLLGVCNTSCSSKLVKKLLLSSETANFVIFD